MIVVDASVLTNALVYSDERGQKSRAVLNNDLEWTAPDHWKVEVFSAVRRLTLGSRISVVQASRAVERIRRLAVDHVPVDELLPRMWQLRSSVSAYDAAYVALAELRRLTLVTGDARLARTASQICRVELVG